MWRFTIALAVGLVALGAASPVWADDVDGDGVDDAIDVCNNTPAGTLVDAEGRPVGDVDQDCDNDLEDIALSQHGFTGPLAPRPAADGLPAHGHFHVLLGRKSGQQIVQLKDKPRQFAAQPSQGLFVKSAQVPSRNRYRPAICRI